MRWLKKLLGKKADPVKAASLVAAGVGHARQGQLDAALAQYEAALEADPAHPLAALNRAIALQDLYNRDRAKLGAKASLARLAAIDTALEQAAALNPGAPNVWRLRGHVAVHRGAYETAARAFETALETAAAHPEPPFEHDKEARDVLRRLSPEIARIAAFRAVVSCAKDPDIAADTHGEALKDALLDVVKAVGDPVKPAGAPAPESPSAEPDAPGEAGAAPARAGRDKAAFLPVEPVQASADVYWASGVVCRKLGDTARARAFFQACLARSDKHLKAHRELAQLAAAQDEAETALTHSVAAYRLDPTDPALLCNVAVCELALGRLERATEFLVLAEELAPKDPIIQNTRHALDAAKAAPQ